MNKLDKIIQHHLDKNLKTVLPKYKKQLSNNDLLKLQSAVELNLKLNSIVVSDNIGKNSLKEALSEIDYQVNPEKQKFSIFSSSFMKAGVAMSAFALIIGSFGLGFFKNRSNNNVSPEVKISSISSNGSVDSINSINLADVEAEKAQLQTEAKVADTAKSDLSSTTNISEAINENF